MAFGWAFAGPFTGPFVLAFAVAFAEPFAVAFIPASKGDLMKISQLQNAMDKQAYRLHGRLHDRLRWRLTQLLEETK